MKNKQVVIVAILAFAVVSCKKDESQSDYQTVADFSFAESGSSSDPDKRRYTFTNLSKNADSYTWIFRDSIVSAAKNPVQELTGGETHNVELIATGLSKSSITKQVVVEKTSAQQNGGLIAQLAGKTWKLAQFKRGADANYLDEVELCKKDNLYTFGTNGEGTVAESDIACNTGGAPSATFQFNTAMFTVPSGVSAGTTFQVIGFSNSSSNSPANVLMQSWVNADKVKWSVNHNELTIEGPAYHSDLPGQPLETILVFTAQ